MLASTTVLSTNMRVYISRCFHSCRFFHVYQRNNRAMVNNIRCISAVLLLQIAWRTVIPV